MRPLVWVLATLVVCTDAETYWFKAVSLYQKKRGDSDELTAGLEFVMNGDLKVLAGGSDLSTGCIECNDNNDCTKTGTWADSSTQTLAGALALEVKIDAWENDYDPTCSFGKDLLGVIADDGRVQKTCNYDMKTYPPFATQEVTCSGGDASLTVQFMWEPDKTNAPPTNPPDTLAPTAIPDTPAPDTPAPDTPAPDTPAPDTPAPDTPAPDTPAPDTPAPDTPAPDTPAPDTPAPDTPAPDTPAPDTPAPDTPAPDTPAPDTPAPDTPAPDTAAPPTLAPTAAPATPAPLTQPPVTLAPTQPPATNAPLTTAPATLAPTAVPATNPPPTIPPTAAPPTPAPISPAPPTITPTEAPATPAPPTTAPDTAAPKTPAPPTLPPPTSAPDTASPPTLIPTPAPPTPAPISPYPPTLTPTDAPATPAPSTTAPDTAAPKTVAPPTVPPKTPVPDTASPPTSIPTPAPPTPAPISPYPPTVTPTDAPVTPAPPTLPPQTFMPDTVSPPTSVPTPAPPTPAPISPYPPTLTPTDAPATPAPLTPVPDTASPPTSVPTPAPPTPAPISPYPPTLTPTVSPPTPAPISPAPPTLMPSVSPATDAPPTVAPGPPRVPLPSPSMELECPRTVSDVDVRDRRFVVHGYLSTGDSTGDPMVQVESVTEYIEGGVEYQSTRRGFVQVVRNSSIPGGFYLYLGHPMYLGGDSETVRLTVTDANTGLTGLCDVDVEATLEEVAVAKEPALARGAGAVVASMGSAGAASTIALLSTATCGSQEKLPFLLHPTGLVLNNNRYFGVIVGNLSIAVGATILSYILVYVVFKFLPQCLPFKNLLAAKGLTRFPSVALFIFLFLYQGTSFASLRLVCYHDTFGELCAGIVSTVFCVVVPVATGRAIKTQVPEMGLYKLDKPRPVYTFMLGPGEWVATTKADLWHQRYLSMIKPYLEKTCWFVVFTFLTSFAVGALNVPKVDTMVQCGHLKLGISILFAATSLLVLGLRPYARGRDNLVFFIMNTLTCTALALQAFGFYSENMNNWRFTTASQLFQGCMLLVMIKAATDLLCELYILWKGRRKELQELQWSDGKYGAIPFSGQLEEKQKEVEVGSFHDNDSTEMLAGGQGLGTSLLSMSSFSEQRRKSYFSPEMTSATGSLYDESDRGAGSGRKLHAPFPPSVKTTPKSSSLSVVRTNSLSNGSIMI